MKPTRKKTILILWANPKDTRWCRPEDEICTIEEALRNDGSFEIKTNLATKVNDLHKILLEYKPQIVHFCGHGEAEGLLFEDVTGKKQQTPVDELARAFELCGKTIECVVLNACNTKPQAEAIHKYIPCVIGMNQNISDKAAMFFAAGFYTGLGNEKSYREAYHLGCNRLGLENMPEEASIPEIFENPIEKRRFDEQTQREANYTWDIFLSYDPSPDWLYREFTQLFKKYLERCLREEIPWKQLTIWDRQDMPALEDDVRKAIPHSLCLIAICSPPYFYSECLVREFSMMLQRDQRLGYPGLVIPINVHGGPNFPPPIRKMKLLDWHEYSTLTSEANDVLFRRFVGEVRDFSRIVAHLIESPPPWDEKFYYDVTPDEAIITSLLQRSKRNFATAYQWGV